MQSLAKFQKLGFISCLLLLGCGRAPTDTNAVKQLLAAAIPPQATPAQVLDYLDNQKLEHTPYRQDVRTGRSIQSAIRDKRKFTLIKTDYGIVFHFDDHDRLVGYDVTPYYTGP
jgi:hypothetical protein